MLYQVVGYYVILRVSRANDNLLFIMNGSKEHKIYTVYN